MRSEGGFKGTIALDQEIVAQAIIAACRIEVAALKPGNVSRYCPGHGMSVEDFLLSADAIAEPMSAREASIGERIRDSVNATRNVVSLNTNLGIILLFAPIAHAALAPDSERSLKTRLKRHLLTLDLMDADLAFQAIRASRPGGLGEAARHDVRKPAEVTLLHAMKEAKDRDLIARQYANGYRDVFDIGLRRARIASGQWHNPEWTAVAVYFAFLTRFPDSLIARKFGKQRALAVSTKAAELEARLLRAVEPESMIPELIEWDAKLKEAGLNPGTSADLTAATLLVLDVQERLTAGFRGRPNELKLHTPAVRV